MANSSIFLGYLRNSFFIAFLLGASLSKAGLEESYRLFVQCDPTGVLAEKMDFGSAVLSEKLRKANSPPKTKEDIRIWRAVVDVMGQLDSIQTSQANQLCAQAEQSLEVMKRSLSLVGIDMEALLEANKEQIALGAKAFAKDFLPQK